MFLSQCEIVRLSTPTILIIIEINGTIILSDSSSIGRIIKSRTLWAYTITNKMTTDSFWIKFPWLGIIRPHFCFTSPNIEMIKTWFLPLPQFTRNFEYWIIGYIIQNVSCSFQVFTHIKFSKVELLSIHLTMSGRVRFLRSIISFYSGVSNIVYWASIPHF